MNHSITLFKDCFTLKQYAAFALSFNRARDQYEKMAETAHFRQICLNKKIFSPFKQGDNRTSISNRQQPPTANKKSATSSSQQTQKDGYKYFIEEWRNYFSHYDSDGPAFPSFQENSNSSVVSSNQKPAKMLRNMEKDIKSLVYEAVVILKERETKLDEDQTVAQQIENKLEEVKKDPLKFFPLSGDIQPTLALIAAPFLTKSQMSFLSGKFFRGKEVKPKTPEHQAQVKPKTPEHQARKKILQTLSQNDRILIKNDAQDESLLSPREEMAYAIWGRLEAEGFYNEEDAKAPDGFPEDQWFMKQLILYLEHTQALPSVEFARTQTKSVEKSDRLEQETIFDSNKRENPLRIRRNTIEAQVCLNGDKKYKTNFGIHALKYLVVGHLFNKPQSINTFTVEWLNKNSTRQGQEKKIFGFSSERLKKHIDHLIEKYSLPIEKIRLYDQIRFICYFINEAWNKKHSKYMHKEEFKYLQKKVRHYNKDDLRSYLEQQKMLDITKLGLGHKDDKGLGEFFSKARIQEVFTDMTSSHIDWLKGQKNILPTLTPEGRKALAQRLSLKNIEKKEPQSKLKPVALKYKDIREEIAKCREEKTPKRFFDYVRELSRENQTKYLSFYGLKIENTEGQKRDSKKNQERAARTGLLLNMVSKLIDESISPNTKKPSDQDITKNLDDKIKIQFKLTQRWRHYAIIHKKQFLKLIKAYHPEFKQGMLPLLDETKSQPAKHPKRRKSKVPSSIQSLKQDLEKERFLLMQAFLNWEKDIIRQNKTDQNRRKEQKRYTSFNEVLKLTNITENCQQLKTCRNICMHNKIWEKRFSQVPEPVQSIYNELKQKDEKKRKKQQQEGQRKGKVL